MTLKRVLLKPAARRKETRVGKYVDANLSGPTRALEGVMVKWRKHIAEAYAARMTKAELTDDEIADAILAELDIAGLSQAMIDEILPDLIEAFKSGESYGLQQVAAGVSTDLVNEQAVAYAKERAGELIKDFAETNAEYVRDLVATAIENGDSAADLADTLDDAGEFGTMRAERIARTELAFAHNEGNIEAWRQSGEVSGKEWLTAPGCCDACAELDGVIVGIDEDFPNDGGSSGTLHPNCRCTVLPVLSEE